MNTANLECLNNSSTVEIISLMANSITLNKDLELFIVKNFKDFNNFIIIKNYVKHESFNSMTQKSHFTKLKVVSLQVTDNYINSMVKPCFINNLVIVNNFNIHIIISLAIAFDIINCCITFAYNLDYFTQNSNKDFNINSYQIIANENLIIIYR